MRSCCLAHPVYTAGCPDCREKARIYALARSRGLQRGTWARMVTGSELEQVRRAVQALLAYPGITVPKIAATVGVGHQTLYLLDRACEMRPDVAQALLAVTPELVMARNPPSRVDSIGVARRLQAMACDDWSAEALSDLSGINRTSLGHWRIRRFPTIARTKHEAVAALYVKIQNTQSRGPSPEAGAHARRCGYLPAERWADEDIDDPDAEPLPELPDTDDQVEIFLQIRDALESPAPGKAAGYDRAVQREIAKRARHDDWPWEQIAELLGFKSASSAEYLVHGGRPDRKPVRRERSK